MDIHVRRMAKISDMNVQGSAPVRAFDWKGASPFMDRSESIN